MRDDYLTQKDLAVRAPEATQNWVPVWPQFDQDYGEKYEWGREKQLLEGYKEKETEYEEI